MNYRSRLTLIALLTAVAAPSFAYPPGVYVGFDAGKSNTHYTPERAGITVAPASSYTTKGLGTRAYLGFQHCSLFGMELGYTYFSSARFLMTAGDALISSHAYDAVMTLTHRTQIGLSGHLKAGVANIDLHPDTRIQNNSTILIKDRSFVRPTYGLGLKYAVNNSVEGTFNWKRIQKGTQNPHADLFSLGVLFDFDM